MPARKTRSSSAGRASEASRSRRVPYYRNESIVFLAVCLVFGMLLYGRALAAPFAAYDDPGNVIHNQALLTWGGVLHYFHSSSVFSRDLGGAGQSYYRPLTWFSFFLDRSLWGLNAAGFHFTNVLLHCVNAFLFFTLLRKLNAALIVAGVAAIVWLALPISAEAVVWISARPYSLEAFFLLLSGLAAQQYLRSKKPILLAAYCCSTVLALLTYEAGILVLPLTVLIFLASDQRFQWGPRRPAIYLFSAAAGASACYLALRATMHGGSATSFSGPAALGLYFFKYTGWMLFPLHMSVERSTSTPPAHVSVPALLAWAALVGLCAAAFGLRHRARWIAGGIAWLILALLPFCGVAFIYQGMAERFTYFASAGLALAVAGAVSLLADSARRSARWQASISKALLVLACVWMAWGVVRLWQREGDWQNPADLYKSSLQANPRSPKLFHNLGDYYLAQGDLDQAEESYRRAIELSPNDTALIINLAATLQKKGDTTAAERLYRRVIALRPADDDAYCDLGVLLFNQGETDSAVQLFSKAMRLNPGDSVPYFDLASVYQNTGHPELAIELYKEVLRRNPEDQDARARLQELGAGD